jgi:hypothetical protein
MGQLIYSEVSMHMSLRRAGLIMATAGLTAVLAATAPALAASAATASPVILDDVLLGVAVTSSSNAWAVGYFTPAGSSSRTLIEHWNGRTWKVVASPDLGGAAGQDILHAVAASPTRAWAVGNYWNGKAAQTLIEHWNGKSWKQVKSVNPGGSGRENTLFAVARSGRSGAWAVGDYGTSSGTAALIEHFNGTAWKQVPSPHPGTRSTLSAVAAVSATNAWAVGYYESGSATLALIEHWNGRSWKVVPSPSSQQKNLFGIAAVSATSAWAVGDAFTPQSQTLTEHWNGKSWKVVPSPDPGGPARFNELNGVAAASSTSVWAIGVYIPGSASRTLIEHWNGKSWRQVKSVNPGVANSLNGVAATATRAWAVGYYHVGSSNLSLIEHWNGTAWQRVKSQNP